MNLPNLLTVIRILLAPAFMFLFLVDDFYFKSAALLLFIAAAITDLLDGYYARKLNLHSDFGRFMDPLADKILVSSALITFVALEALSPIPVMLIVGREFLITGLRMVAAYNGEVIPPSWWAKVKTFLQMTVIAVGMAWISLLSGLAHFESPLLAHLQFDYVPWFNMLAWATAAVTVWTGIDYVVKYFSVIKSVMK